MENLKGRRILIGKEPKFGRLLIAVKGIPNPIALGAMNRVPDSVSRCLIHEGIAHAELIVEPSGVMILRNMKGRNITLVNGSEINSKRVTPSNIIELGPDRYPINLEVILKVASRIVETTTAYHKPNSSQQQNASPPTPAKQYSILHLKGIWDSYHESIIDIQKRGRTHGTNARIPMFFTMGGGALTLPAFICGWGEEVKIACSILTLIGFILMGYFFLRSKNDTSIEERERLTEDFTDKYICPNPDCQKFLGNLSYRLLKRQYSMHCPYCKCEFIEK